MGRVRTKTVKKSSRQVIERYYSRMTLDFHTNKKVLEEVAIIPSKRLRNKIAGFSTHLMKRIQKGPVRGISLKLQEEERERRMDFVPDVSAINTDEIPVDKETIDMLAMLGMNDLPGVVKAEPVVVSQPVFARNILDRKRYWSRLMETILVLFTTDIFSFSEISFWSRCSILNNLLIVNFSIRLQIITVWSYGF